MSELTTWALVKVHTAGLARLSFEPHRFHCAAPDAGEALWVADTPPQRVGLAFPWSRIPPGLIVLSDAMSITTNALFVDDGGVIAPRLQLLCCVSLLHRLPWQAELRRELAQRGG